MKPDEADVSDQEIRQVNGSAYSVYRQAGNCDHVRTLYDEIAWFALGDSVLGALIRDRIDNDYGGVVMTPDDHGQYRFVDCVHSLPTPDAATKQLHAAMRAAAAQNLPQPHRICGPTRSDPNNLVPSHAVKQPHGRQISWSRQAVHTAGAGYNARRNR
jgi:hypothetical protein